MFGMGPTTDFVFEHITCGTLLDEISPNEYYQPKPDAHQGDNSPVTTMAANGRGIRRFRLNPFFVTNFTIKI